MDLTAETLSALAGGLLSLAAAYAPGFSERYAAMDSLYKRLVMLGLLALAAAGCLALSCAGWAQALGAPALTCDRPGALAALRAFLAALTANQATYLLAARRTVRDDDLDALASLGRILPEEQNER